ncbi:phosphatase PAP2 family protein, partial [Bacteroidota bacterium]
MYNWYWDTWIILQLQDAGNWLRPIMDLFTWLGYPQAYMVVIAIIYWSFDRKMGLRMAVFLPLSASFNSLVKQAFHAPRPFWVDQGILGMHADNGFGLPSGHAQSATVWLLAASYLKKRVFWIIAVLVTFMVGFSRAYLGVHFPSQIIFGWLIGILIIILFIQYESAALSWLNKMNLINQILFVTGCSLGIILIGSLLVLNLNHWEMPQAWILNTSGQLTLSKSILKSYGMASVA